MKSTPAPKPAVQQAPASAMGAPRDARYGGAFMRGPAESYRPGYGKAKGPMRPVLEGVGNILSGFTKRAQSRASASAAPDVSDEMLGAIFSGKFRLPNVPGSGMSEGTVSDVNDAMLLQALMAAMKKSRKR